MSLAQLQKKCLDLALDLSRNAEITQAQAGPFVSVPALSPDLHPRIMYVGKATRGDFYREEFLRDPTLTARQDQIHEFLRESAPRDSHGFWRFARMLADLATPKQNEKHVRNIVWSNLMRIGSQTGNPRHALGHAQAGILKDVLVAEVEEYRPDIVVFVTCFYWNEVITQAYPDWIGELSAAELSSGRFRPAKGDTPPML